MFSWDDIYVSLSTIVRLFFKMLICDSSFNTYQMYQILFDFELTLWRLFQKRVNHTKFDIHIYVFITFQLIPLWLCMFYYYTWS